MRIYKEYVNYRGVGFCVSFGSVRQQNRARSIRNHKSIAISTGGPVAVNDVSCEVSMAWSNWLKLRGFTGRRKAITEAAIYNHLLSAGLQRSHVITHCHATHSLQGELR